VVSVEIYAETPKTDLPVLKTRIKTLAAFKNGLGFVFRSGETVFNNGSAEIEAVPAAVHGTYWVGSTNSQNPVEELVSYRKTSPLSMAAMSISELMRANIGKKMIVTLTGDRFKNTQITGKLISMHENTLATNFPSRGSGFSDIPIDHQGTTTIALFEVNNNNVKSTVAVNWTQVVSLQIIGNINTKIIHKQEISSARIRLKGKPARGEIIISYLQKGFNWSPSYMVDLVGDNQAQITMDAVLANDVEDINDASVSFVVGYPSFAYADAITPLALNQTVGEFLQGIARSEGSRAGDMGSIMQQSAASNSSGAYENRQWMPSDAYSVASNLPGESNEDLYFYKQDHVNIKKGQRARYTVMTAKVPMEHIYMLDIPDSSKITVQGSRLDRGSNEPAVYQVWHALRLDNNTGIPWTTAPAMAVKGSLPLAQGLLKYTAPSTKTALKLTVATDIRVQQDQIEESRKTVNIRRYDYSEVTVSGKITISNFKNTTARMSVLKSIVGKIVSSGDGKTREVAVDLNGINPATEIQWEFDLPAGQSKELTYTYAVNVM